MSGSQAVEEGKRLLFSFAEIKVIKAEIDIINSLFHRCFLGAQARENPLISLFFYPQAEKESTKNLLDLA